MSGSASLHEGSSGVASAGSGGGEGGGRGGHGGGSNSKGYDSSTRVADVGGGGSRVSWPAGVAGVEGGGECVLQD